MTFERKPWGAELLFRSFDVAEYFLLFINNLVHAEKYSNIHHNVVTTLLIHNLRSQ